MGKRRRDAEKARKKKEKAERRERKRRDGPSEIPISDPEAVTGDLEVVERRMKARRAEAGPRTIPSKLFVGSLSWGVDDNLLRETFEKYGKVSEAVVVCDRDTGRSRGFGFVVMEDRKDAAKAIDELDGAELDGREIVVNIATERKR
jgi:RNA recognition motif-containing protein